MAVTNSVNVSSKNEYGVVPYDYFVDNTNVESFTFTPPRSRNGRMSVLPLFEGSRVTFETNWFVLPFDVAQYQGQGNWKMMLTDRFPRELVSSGDGTVEKEQAQQFFRLLHEDFNEALVRFGTNHSKEIFGTEHPEQVVRALTTNPVKFSDEWGYQISAKVPETKIGSGVPNVELYVLGTHEEKTLSSFEDLNTYVRKGSRVRLTIRANWYCLNGKQGLSFSVERILTRPRMSGRRKGYAFSDTFEETSEPAGSGSGSATTETTDDVEEESDYDDDDGSELELED